MAAPARYPPPPEGNGRVTSDPSLWLPPRLREATEQRTLAVILRMPLHGQHPRLAVRRLGALDHAVGRPGRGAQRRREVADRLMVAAVHGGLQGGDGAMQEGAGLDPQAVARPRVRVIDLARPLARPVLVQRPAERDVEDLDAPANRQDREPAGAGGRDQGELLPVPGDGDLSPLRARGGVVACPGPRLAARRLRT